MGAAHRSRVYPRSGATLLTMRPREHMLRRCKPGEAPRRRRIPIQLSNSPPRRAGTIHASRQPRSDPLRHRRHRRRRECSPHRSYGARVVMSRKSFAIRNTVKRFSEVARQFCGWRNHARGSKRSPDEAKRNPGPRPLSTPHSASLHAGYLLPLTAAFAHLTHAISAVASSRVVPAVFLNVQPSKCVDVHQPETWQPVR